MTRELLLPNQWTDVELLPRLIAREGRAWREFHRRFGRVIAQTVRKTAHGRWNQADFEDLEAQVLVALTDGEFRRLRAFDSSRGVRLSSWIRVITRNVTLDAMRRRSRRIASGMEQDENQAASDSPFNQVSSSPFEIYAVKELVERVNDAVNELSARDQDLVRLLYIEGLEPDRVADAMSISVNTVYSKRHKIRARLREMIA